MRSAIIAISVIIFLPLVLGGIAAGQDRAMDELLGNLSHSDAKVRAEAAWALGKSGEEVAVQPLIGALSDEDRNVREWAALGLARIGTPAVAALCSALKGTEDDSYGEGTSWQAAAVLGLIGDANASRPLQEALQSNSSTVRYWAAQALGSLGDNSSKESLTSALGDENASVRYEAGLALRETQGAGAADLLAGLLLDGSSNRRAGAARALGEMEQSSSVPALVAALQDGQAPVRLEAARALGRLGDGQAAEPLVRLLSDSDDGVRSQAISSLQAIGEPAENPLVSALKGAENGSEEALAAAEGAALALGGIGEESSSGALEEVFLSGGERIRVASARAMIEINSSRTALYMISLLNSSAAPAEVRAGAARALGEAGEASGREPLIQAMSGDSDGEVRMSAARALKSMGGGEVKEYKL
jgi:HEAT repeat protein